MRTLHVAMLVRFRAQGSGFKELCGVQTVSKKSREDSSGQSQLYMSEAAHQKTNLGFTSRRVQRPAHPKALSLDPRLTLRVEVPNKTYIQQDYTRT